MGRAKGKRIRDKSGDKAWFGKGDCKVLAFALKSKGNQELQE